MLPFLFDDLKGLVKTLLRNINPSILEKSKTVKELLDIKLDDQKKLLKTKDIHIGFAATNEIQKHLQKDTVTIDQVRTFKREATIATLKKIYAKYPLLFDVVKNCTIFNLEKIQPDRGKYLRKKKAKLLFQKFVNLNFLTFSKSDKAYIQVL